MFLDARDIAEGAQLQADICVIGAGAAGLSLVRSLRGSGKSILVLESGGLDRDPSTDELSQGSRSGWRYPPLERTRSRFFGGSTNCWEGFCRPLDPIDFEERDWVPHSGWPFPQRALAPYYARARALLGLPDDDQPAPDWLGGSGEGPEIAPIGLQEGLFHFGDGPLRMGGAFRDELTRSTRVRVALHANVTQLVLDPLSGTLARTEVRALGRRPFSVVASQTVLATGGIENARILLASRDVAGHGVGNQNDLVGRFFMEHPHLRYHARLIAHSPAQVARYSFQETPDGYVRGMLQPLAGWLRDNRSLNFDVQFRGPETRLSRSMRQLADASAQVDAWPTPAPNRPLQPAHFGLILHHEQAPNPASRVTLASQRDALGTPRAHLHWQLDALDWTSAVQAHELAARAMGFARLGRASLDLNGSWPQDMTGGNHHMGTTRMHTDPRRGVTNPDGAIHGVPNLFVAGSSVFPTAGAANPTLTLVALAIRMADHLRRMS